MDGKSFDHLTRVMGAGGSRRGLLRLLGVGLAAGLTRHAVPAADAAARCRAVRAVCREHANCCTGICGPKDRTGRRRCQCPAGLTACNGACVDTSTDAGNCGGCNSICPTTGETSLCQGAGVCTGGVCVFDPLPEGERCGAEGTQCLSHQRCDGTAGTCPARVPRRENLSCDTSGAGENQGYCRAGECTACQRGPNGGVCNPASNNCCPGTTCRRNDSNAGPFQCRAND